MFIQEAAIEIPARLPDDPVGYIETIRAVADQIVPILDEKYPSAIVAIERLAAPQTTMDESSRLAALGFFGCLAVDVHHQDPNTLALDHSIRRSQIRSALRFLRRNGVNV